MPFLDSLDIANRALQHCGARQIRTPTEDSKNNKECAFAYDKLREAELRRNVWGFAVRKTVLRPIDSNTLLIVPAVYDATRTYLPGDIVQDTNGLLWISERADNVNNAPGGNNEYWEMYFGPMTADMWETGGSYFAGEVVYMLTGTTPNGYQLYVSLINNNADTPNVATAYDSTVQYKQDDVVSSGGSQWRSLLPVNLGNTPADGPLSFDPTSIYASGNQVTGSDNYIYTSLSNGNTGHDPTTDGGIHWTNTNTLNAWSRSPVLLVASTNWRPIKATLRNINMIYPVGAGPASQNSTRNVFHLPAGYLRKAPQSEKIPVAALGAPVDNIQDDWEFNGNFLVSSDLNPIVFRFVADITKVSRMNAMFCEGLACRVGIAVCEPLTQSTTKINTIASEYRLVMGEARQVNAIEQDYVDPPDDEWLSVRL